VDIEKISKNPLDEIHVQRGITLCQSILAVIGYSQTMENIILEIYITRIQIHPPFSPERSKEKKIAGNIHDSSTSRTDTIFQMLSLYLNVRCV